MDHPVGRQHLIIGRPRCRTIGVAGFGRALDGRAGATHHYRTMSYDDLPGLITAMPGEGPHPTSTLDVLWVLYDRVLQVSPETVDDPARDRFVLSKGHGPQAYYAVLAAKGFIPASWLRDVGSATSPLGGHPDRVLVPGVEISSGSLGHGLPIAVGMAHCLSIQRIKARVVTLVGDAELDEGSNHEAIPYAAAIGLENLTVVVIENGSASHRWPGGVANAFPGWHAATVPGRDHRALEAALSDRPSVPNVVVAVVESKE